jgi:hypothetical protein
MNDRCSACDEKFEREPGQWLGALYLNLGLTTGLALAGFFITHALTALTMMQQFVIWVSVAALGPFVFYRVAKGLWTSIVFLGEGLYLDWPSR